jgi:hypothetical protein
MVISGGVPSRDTAHFKHKKSLDQPKPEEATMTTSTEKLPTEFEFQYRIAQTESELRSAQTDYEYETRTLCKLANERLNDRIGRGTEALVSKAGRLLALETKIVDLTRQYDWLIALKKAWRDA